MTTKKRARNDTYKNKRRKRHHTLSDSAYVVPELHRSWWSCYSEAVYNYFFENQKNHPVTNISYSEKDEDEKVTAGDLQTLMTWVVDVIWENKASFRVICLTRDYIDRFLSTQSSFPKKSLQLLAAAAILIASKLEDKCHIYVGDLESFSDDSCSIKSIIDMERRLLKTLQYDIITVIDIDFINLYFVIVYSSRLYSTQKQSDFILIEKLSIYLLYTSALYAPLTSFLPSIRAAAALSLAALTFKLRVWNKTLESYSRLSRSDPILLNCVKLFHSLHKIIYADSEMAVSIKEKYSQLACVPPLPEIPLYTLT